MVCNYFFYKFLSHEYVHSNFWDYLLAMITFKFQGFFALQFTTFFLFHSYFIFILKSKVIGGDEPENIIDSKAIETYLKGILVIMIINLFLGNGIYYLFSNSNFDLGLGNTTKLIEWFHDILFVVLPVITVFLSLQLIRKRYNYAAEKFPWDYFVTVGIIILLLSIFINYFTSLLISLLIKPFQMIFHDSVYSIVVTGFIAVVIMIIGLILHTDLLVAILKRSTKKTAKDDHPEVID